MTSITSRRTDYDNSNSGALYSNGAPLTDALISGVWENAQGHKFGLAISADVNGQRTIAVLSKTGGVVSKGTVQAVRSTNGKAPAYRGNLGNLRIVLWNMSSYYQVRIDAGAPKPSISTEAAALLGLSELDADDTVGPEIDEYGPF